MKRTTVLFASVLFSICCVAASAQGSSQANAQAAKPATKAKTAVIHSSAQDVLLDMIFRDKHGKPIHDIQRNQVHVYQNGVEMPLDSFTLVKNMSNPLEGSQTYYDPMRQLRTVTLVFEGLTPEGKRFFRRALENILKMAPEQNLYFSVYVVDQYLHCIQPFTNNHKDLVNAVKKSMAWSFIDYSKNSAKIQASLANIVAQGQPVLQSTGNAGPNQNSINAFVQYQMAQMQYNMLQEAATGERGYGSRIDIDALQEIVNAEARLPGRKVVLYFNPSLIVSEDAKEQFHHMITEANRSNVSFYTVDPKGLVSYNQTGAGQNQLNNVMSAVRSNQQAGGAGEVTIAQARAQDNAIGAIRSDPELWLRALASDTGGKAIINTNDLNKPLQTVMDEVGTYYEASYNPHIKVYNGKFMKITVKVDRPGVHVITRSGFYALPKVNGSLVKSYELPMLNAINAATPPTDLTLRAAAERFSERGSQVQYMLVLEVPMKGLTFKPEADKVHALLNASLMAVVKDSAGDIVKKFSKQFAVQVKAKDIKRYQEGQLVRTFETTLPPGTYTLDAAVSDQNANKMGVKASTFKVPKPTSHLTISDAVIVLRKDKLKNNKIEDPFYFPGGKVVPTLNHTLQGGKGNYLPFYFAVYPNQSAKTPPKLTMSFYKSGQYLGSAPVKLPPANKNGRIPYIAAIPATQFQPGNYEITFEVEQGKDGVENTVHFQIK
jgi:VWFA-related protein